MQLECVIFMLELEIEECGGGKAEGNMEKTDILSLFRSETDLNEYRLY